MNAVALNAVSVSERNCRIVRANKSVTSEDLVALQRPLQREGTGRPRVRFDGAAHAHVGAEVRAVAKAFARAICEVVRGGGGCEEREELKSHCRQPSHARTDGARREKAVGASRVERD